MQYETLMLNNTQMIGNKPIQTVDKISEYNKYDDLLQEDNE